jgi:hypothetical protein
VSCLANCAAKNLAYCATECLANCLVKGLPSHSARDPIDLAKCEVIFLEDASLRVLSLHPHYTDLSPVLLPSSPVTDGAVSLVPGATARGHQGWVDCFPRDRSELGPKLFENVDQ